MKPNWGIAGYRNRVNDFNSLGLQTVMTFQQYEYVQKTRKYEGGLSKATEGSYPAPHTQRNEGLLSIGDKSHYFLEFGLVGEEQQDHIFIPGEGEPISIDGMCC